LIDCGSLRSAFDYIARARKAFPEDSAFEKHDANLTSKISTFCKAKNWDLNDIEIEDYPEKGFVRREQYPWNLHEPERSSDECLEFLNAEMEAIAPMLEIKLSKLPLINPSAVSPDAEVEYVQQLGVFAKEDIPPGACVLEEKSLLTSISRLYESYCDACSLALPNSQNATTSFSAASTAMTWPRTVTTHRFAASVWREVKFQRAMPQMLSTLHSWFAL
jgi:hypothetical protein